MCVRVPEWYNYTLSRVTRSGDKMPHWCYFGSCLRPKFGFSSLVPDTFWSARNTGDHFEEFSRLFSGNIFRLKVANSQSIQINYYAKYQNIDVI